MIPGTLNINIEKYFGETPRETRQAHAVSEEDSGEPAEGRRSDRHFFQRHLPLFD